MVDFLSELLSLVVELCKKERVAGKHGSEPKAMKASLHQMASKQSSGVLSFSTPRKYTRGPCLQTPNTDFFLAPGSVCSSVNVQLLWRFFGSLLLI